MSKQIFALIAQHFSDLSELYGELSEASGGGVETNATEYLAQLAGTDVSNAVHTGGVVGPVTGASPAPSALELFTGKPAASQGEPVYTMLVEDFTREQHHASNWTDEMLVSNGKMTIDYPKPPAPAAPPPANAATPTPPAGATPTPGGTSTPLIRDKSGLPWDARIHSGGRTQTKAELWTAKKGVSPALVAQVTSELLAGKATPFVPPLAAPAPAAPPVAAAPPAPAAAPQAPAAPGTASDALAAANASIAAEAANPTTFSGAMGWLKANNLTPAHALEAAQQVDPAIVGWGFMARPEYIGLMPTIIEVLKATHGK